MNTIDEMLAAMTAEAGNAGLAAVYAKILAANDNSKNQVYLGGGFGALNILPHGEITLEDGPQGNSGTDRFYASLDLSWMHEDGAFPAPGARLILYPDYPEVRFSGFLRGCVRAPSDVMSGANARTPGRLLFFGITGAGRILAYVALPGDPIVVDFDAQAFPSLGVFADLSAQIPGINDPIALMRTAVARVAALGWTPSVKLDQDGVAQPYSARNAAGYTLEAALGVRPNSRAEPDYEGWEVKQYGVDNFERLRAGSPVTLMTPEPDGGLYHGDIRTFMDLHGYPDKHNPEGRRNFGGVYRVGGAAHDRTGLRITLVGFDHESGKVESGGGIQLIDTDGIVKASWSFAKLLAHWGRKHARVAYIPSLKQDEPVAYMFSERATLCIGTDFIRFLKAMHEGQVWLDPALKAPVEGAVVGAVHRRCQFRIRHEHLGALYEREELL